MNILSRPIYKIGLTGGIGAGKTTVIEIFKTLGIPTFNSDQCGRNILLNDKGVIKNTIQLFGKSILKKNKIDTIKLGKIVFDDKSKLHNLNKIIHPCVLQKFNEWAIQQTKKYIIKESALLFESGTYKMLDKIILVKAPIHLRIKRVRSRDGKSSKEVMKIINNQVKEKDIIKHVDYVINNNEKTLLVQKIIRLDRVLSSL